MHVSLSFEPGSEVHLHDPIEGVLEIPTIPPPLEEVGAAVRNLVDRVTRLDLEAVFGSLQRALDGIAALTGGPEARNALTSLDHVLVDLDELIRGMQPLSKELLTLVQRADALRSELESGVGSARGDARIGGHAGKRAREHAPAPAQEPRERIRPPGRRHGGAAVHAGVGARARRSGRAHRRGAADEPAGAGRHAALARAVFELIERDPAVILRGRGEDGGR
jgi:hypothetical protein